MIPGIVAGAGGSVGPAPVTWNPSDKSAAITLSGANLIATSDATLANKLVRATLSRSSGKHYFEIATSAGTDISLGVADSALALSAYVGNNAASYGYYQLDGSKYNNSSGSAYGADFQGAQVIGVAVDLDGGKIWFSKNGAWQASGDPASGTNPAFTGLTGAKFPAANIYNSSVSVTGRFASSAFTYSPPSGFSAWDP